VYPVAEFVFNTATTGYEEVITDPSYGGQVVVFTTPHLGTTGWTGEECESLSVAVSGVICRHLVSHDDNYLARSRLRDVLLEARVPVVSGVDTRALTLLLRQRGTMQGRVVVGADEAGANPPSDLLAAKNHELRVPLAIMPRAAVAGEAASPAKRASLPSEVPAPRTDRKLRVGVVDFGVKASILEALHTRGAETVCFGWDTVTADHVRAARVDGLVFSNGAGDPRCLLEQPNRLVLFRELAESYVSRGICFGHQALALAYGAKINKLAFGHHAINHPVATLDATGKTVAVAITSQNHNYAVDLAGLPGELEMSHLHLNDKTVAGLRHRKGYFQSVQFHPEAGPGPRDAATFFDDFFVDMRERPRC
jgi:carbamoyl-phosphate synthase small subunit